MKEKPRILIVDDDENTCRTLKLIFDKKGYVVDIAGTGREALEQARESVYNLILLDIKLPDMEGTELISPLKDICPDTNLLMVTAFASLESAVRALHEGAMAYVTKPLNMDEVLALAKQALERQCLVMEKRQAEEALRESEEKYRTILQSMNDIVLVVDKRDCYSQYYTSSEELLFVSPKEFMGRQVSEVLPSSVAERFVESFMRVRETAGSEVFDYLLEIDDQTYWFSAVLSLHEDGESIVQVVRNITRRKQAEEAMQESEKKYRLLAENTFDCIWQVDLNANFTYVNPAIFRVFGFTPEEWVGSSLSEHCSPEAMEFMFGIMMDAIRNSPGAIPVKFETRMVRKDGKEIDVEITGKLTLDKDETPLGFQGITRDITERKRAEEALQESEEWFRTIYEESPISINVFDLDGNLIHANPALLNLVGVSSVEDLKNFNIFRDPNLPEGGVQRIRNNESAQYQSVIDFAKVKEAGLYDTSKSGVRHVDVRMSPLKYGEDGSLHGYMIQMVDITERVLAEANTKAAAETAMLYLDLMGHDIRNHLQAIIIGTEILEQLDIRPEVREMVDLVVDSVEHSRNLIKKVQSTRGLLSVPLSSTPLRNALEDCLQVLNETYDDVQVNVNWGAQQPTVIADKYLGSLLMNILENAILHNDKKTRRVWVDLREAKGGYEVVIADNGSGIDNDKKESLFDQSRRFGGVGVHQAFRIAQKYGGHITVQDRVPSDSNKGAEFHIWFPKSTA